MLLKSWLAPSVLLLSLSLPAAAAPAPSVPRGPEYRINTSTATSHGNPSIFAYPDGGFVVIWYSNRIRARFLDAQGRPGREIALAMNGLADQVIVDSNGNFLVVSATSTPSSPATGIFVRRFNRDGSPLGKRIRVSNLSTSERSSPVIASGPNGSFAVVWKADVRVPQTGEIYTNAVGRIFSADGTPVTPEIVLGAGEPATGAGDDKLRFFPSSLAMKPDGTLVALVLSSTGDGCYPRGLVQMPPGGKPASLGRGLGSFCGIPGYEPSTALAIRPDGNLIAAWRDYDQILAQQFAPDGTSRGEWYISPSPDFLQSVPAIAVQAGGRFVITWSEQDESGESRGVFGRSFAPNGTPRTGTYRINVTTEGGQSGPAIAAGRQGLIVAVWAQGFEDRADIFARVLAANP